MRTSHYCVTNVTEQR